MKNKLTVLLATMFLATFSNQAFSDDAKHEAGVKYETMKISFDKNSSVIDRSSREQLRRKVQSLKKAKDLEQITIAGYSDQAYPPEPNKKLSDMDSDLADERISSVKSAISDLEGIGIDVESYNLAEEPNPFEKWLKTDDYKLKSGMKKNATNTPRNLRLISEEGKTQSALVVFKIKEKDAKAKKDSEVFSE